MKRNPVDRLTGGWPHGIGPRALVRRLHCIRPCADCNALLRPPQRREAFRLQRTSLARVGTSPRGVAEAAIRCPRAAPPSLTHADPSAAPFSFFLYLPRTGWLPRARRCPTNRGRLPAETPVALGRVARPRRCKWFQISRLSGTNPMYCRHAIGMPRARAPRPHGRAATRRVAATLLCAARREHDPAFSLLHADRPTGGAARPPRPAVRH